MQFYLKKCNLLDNELKHSMQKNLILCRNVSDWLLPQIIMCLRLFPLYIDRNNCRYLGRYIYKYIHSWSLLIKMWMLHHNPPFAATYNHSKHNTSQCYLDTVVSYNYYNSKNQFSRYHRIHMHYILQLSCYLDTMIILLLILQYQ